MTIHLLEQQADLAAYDAQIRAHALGTLWQSTAWKAYQETLGRTVRIYRTEGASALVVIDRGVGGFATWDVPRGPLWTNEKDLNGLLETIIADAKKDRCIELTLSPVTPLPAHRFPLTTSARHVQPQATRVINLSASEDQILAQMHQKGRYNISLSGRSGVRVREGSAGDVSAFYELLKATGNRDGFTISQASHYARFLSSLEGSFILIAERDGRPIAGLLGVIWEKTGVYYYGASAYEYRSLMAPYALQWAAVQHCKQHGCTAYDLLGVSPEPTVPNDPWLGISDFKRKFGGELRNYPAEQALTLRPMAKAAFALKRRILG